MTGSVLVTRHYDAEVFKVPLNTVSVCNSLLSVTSGGLFIQNRKHKQGNHG